MHSRFDIRLSVEGLALSRGHMTLISGLNFSLAPGQALWLTGPNGVGKTTLLLACADLLALDSGTVLWTRGATSLASCDALSYAAHRGPERSELTLGEELSFWQSLCGDGLALEDRLASVGLDGHAATPISGLSTGQRRRLSLARLIASDRGAWLMDEPLAGLDDDGRVLVTGTLGLHLRDGGMAIIASHQPVPIDGVEALKLVLEPGA